MAPKFGTSGLRGLVTELTDSLVADYTRAFLQSCDTGAEVHVGWDLRPSSPDIAATVMRTVASAGLPVRRAGAVPTPALALAAQERSAAAIMITGSHIPADRNGLKFYTPSGEIGKEDEQRIANALGAPAGTGDAEVTETDAASAYVERYTGAFGPAALEGLTVGVYQHSSVARDILTSVIEAMGARAIALARSDEFIPVDTEAVDPGTRQMLAEWCDAHGLDAVISTDGDADRPMVADATGRIVPGDILGPLTARALGADTICTPVSSNTAVEAMGFARVERTRIGSPFVIAAMEAAGSAEKTVGYEANGGFLLGFEAPAPLAPLPPLMTRDSVLPIVTPLWMARSRGQGLADLVATLPARFTAADRIAGIAPETSADFLDTLRTDRGRRTAFFAGQGTETDIDLTDGLRVTFRNGDIVHLRPSGNAPEFRCYAESDSYETAADLVGTHLARLREALA